MEGKPMNSPTETRWLACCVRLKKATDCLSRINDCLQSWEEAKELDCNYLCSQVSHLENQANAIRELANAQREAQAIEANAPLFAVMGLKKGGGQ